MKSETYESKAHEELLYELGELRAAVDNLAIPEHISLDTPEVQKVEVGNQPPPTDLEPVIERLTALEEAVRAIKPTETVKVSNPTPAVDLTPLRKALTDLRSDIKALKLSVTVKAPDNADPVVVANKSKDEAMPVRLVTHDGKSFYTATSAGSAAGSSGGVAGSTETSNPSATVSSVSGATSSTTLLASNDNRLGFTIYNDSSATLYVKYGSGASTSSFTFKLDQDDFYEAGNKLYSGLISGVWGSATGAARVTEF